MQYDEVVICGECTYWADGKCHKPDDHEPEEMGIGELACEEFEEMGRI